MAAPPNSYGFCGKLPLSHDQMTNDDTRINVNDPGLITLVNKLQDVFTTVGVSARTCIYQIYRG